MYIQFLFEVSDMLTNEKKSLKKNSYRSAGATCFDDRNIYFSFRLSYCDYVGNIIVIRTKHKQDCGQG